MKRPSRDHILSLKATFEKSTDLIAIIPLIGPVEYINSAGIKLLGAEKDGEIYFSNHRPDWALNFLKDTVFPEAQKSGSWTGQNYYIGKSGDVIPVLQTIILLENKDGKRDTIFTFARRLKKDWELGEKFSRNDFFSRLFFLKSSQPIYVFDFESRKIIEANPSFLDLLGYSRDDLGKLSLYDFAVQKEPGKLEKNISLAHDSKEGNPVTFGHWKKRNGEIIPVEVDLTRMELDQEVMVVIGKDISERKEAEVTIRESEERYRTLIQHLSDGLLYLDMDGKVLFVNDRFCDMSGYKREELLGKLAWELMFDASNQSESFDCQKDELSSSEAEFCLLRKDKIKIRVRNSTSPLLNPEGKITGTIGLFSDITQERETQTQLEYKKRELDTFIYRASHDLKAPLNSLQGLVKVAEMEVNEPIASEYFKLIGKVANKLNSSLVGLLQLTLLKEGEPGTFPIYIYSIIEKVFASMAKEARESSITLLNHLDKDLLFHSDPKLLTVILEHLLQNALRFYRDEEKSRKIEVKGSLNNLGVTINVIDNGQGIPVESQPKVFDMFYHTGQMASGSGLGLYISKNAVEKLGGKISLISTLGLETEFRIDLPFPTVKVRPNGK